MERTVTETTYEQNHLVVEGAADLAKHEEIRMKEENDALAASEEPVIEEPWDGYCVSGGYKVREVFDGEEELTDLLAQYVECIASVRF